MPPADGGELAAVAHVSSRGEAQMLHALLEGGGTLPRPLTELS